MWGVWGCFCMFRLILESFLFSVILFSFSGHSIFQFWDCRDLYEGWGLLCDYSNFVVIEWSPPKFYCGPDFWLGFLLCLYLPTRGLSLPDL